MESPADDLLAAAKLAVPGWLVRCVVGTVRRRDAGPGGEPLSVLVADAEAMSRDASPEVLAALHRLLATDVDAQTTNPLTVLRESVRHPTRVLVQHGIRPPTRDEFAARAFPDDLYGLSPATWADVDESLAEPGLVWGAWKAMTVLRRRRDAGTPAAPGLNDSGRD